MIPPEKNGFDGVTGEEVYFEDDELKSNVKVFTERLPKLIENGIKQLSIGYRCLYHRVQGVFQGKKYDFEQVKIRGNHLASVPEGRSGPEIAVLDHFIFTFDTKDVHMIEKEPSAETRKEEIADTEEISLGSLSQKLDKLVEMLTANLSLEKEEARDTESVEATPEEEIADSEMKKGGPTDPSKGSAIGEIGKDGYKEAGSMDAKLRKLGREFESFKKDGVKAIFSEINAAGKLAKELSYHVGTFDHAVMTVADVAKYGVDKLNLVCKAGQEEAAVIGFLAGRQAQTIAVATAQDSVKSKSTQIDDYIRGAH